MQLGDGIEFFRRHAAPEVVARLLARCCIWIDPACYRRLPVWAPYTWRKAPLYKANWIDRQTNNGQLKTEGNVAASKAQNRYLGVTGRNADTRPNWACCHVWGNDDSSFQSSHAEVNDPRYFTCAANMVLVPSPLKTFTDTVPEVKAALRFAAHLLYEFVPEGRSVPDAAAAGGFLPDDWQNEKGIRFQEITPGIAEALDRQFGELQRLHSSAGSAFPREEVNRTIRYWRERVPGSLYENWTG